MKKEYAVLIDHKAAYGNDNYHPFMIEATDVITAMNIAETYMDETVYLIEVLEKVSGTIKGEGCKKVEFEEILTNRGRGWHSSDAKHGESRSIWNRVRNSSRDFAWEYWEIKSITDC